MEMKEEAVRKGTGGGGGESQGLSLTNSKDTYIRQRMVILWRICVYLTRKGVLRRGKRVFSVITQGSGRVRLDRILG